MWSMNCGKSIFQRFEKHLVIGQFSVFSVFFFFFFFFLFLFFFLLVTFNWRTVYASDIQRQAYGII